MNRAKRMRETDEVRQRKIARLRFRNLVRNVSLNRIWLLDTGEQKLSLNVKKNIAMLVRTHRKIGLLTMAEKTLIRTPYHFRTNEERKKLVALMTNLTCFSRLPPKVRARLAKCIKFMVIGAGRTLMKEGGMPLMVYFLLTGEVELSRRVYDGPSNSWINRIDMISGPGECLGDIEILEGCMRRHTYTTASVVELLVVFREDFESILRPVMERQWMEKKNSMQTLEYFHNFTKDQIIDGCKLSVIREFKPLETIYDEDKGHLDYVFFVVSGECLILQSLEVVMIRYNRKVGFQLLDHSTEKSDVKELLPESPKTPSLPFKGSKEFVSLGRSKNYEIIKTPRQHFENHFIDVGSITFGGIFGLGEQLEHRVIMARTTVQCLMIPRFWLLEKAQNPGNIWQRRRIYLNSTIPSRQSLFQDFLRSGHWEKFKTDYITNLLDQYSIANPTRIQEIPIICRITENSE
ncbi:cyclic nucleotide-binding domain-containing protein 2-like [Haematobia irritans]|uniref:cyclic nucleotide-binding domain-containing protein 2-like n=1 Tax=Haematobia irritans TaxID=7368 RepID=UPI003F4F6A72